MPDIEAMYMLDISKLDKNNAIERIIDEISKSLNDRICTELSTTEHFEVSAIRTVVLRTLNRANEAYNAECRYRFDEIFEEKPNATT